MKLALRGLFAAVTANTVACRVLGCMNADCKAYSGPSLPVQGRYQNPRPGCPVPRRRLGCVGVRRRLDLPGQHPGAAHALGAAGVARRLAGGTRELPQNTSAVAAIAFRQDRAGMPTTQAPAPAGTTAMASHSASSISRAGRSRLHASPHLGTRQYARIVDGWVKEIGLDPARYGTLSVRRTKPTLIYRRTRNLRAVQLLLGHQARKHGKASWHRGRRRARDR
jgi:hypothetical protein